MAIQRNEVAEPQWDKWDYVEKSKHDVFSRERWNKTVEWNVLLEHAKNTENACHLLFENTYPSSLFHASIDLLEANIYAFGDLFYWLTGLNANTLDPDLICQAASYIFFWNMRFYKELRQIQQELQKIKSLFIECLMQTPLWDKLIESPEWKSEDGLSNFRRRMEEHVWWTEKKSLTRHPAYEYVREIYKMPEADEEDLIQRITKILQLTGFFVFLLGSCGDCCYYDFASLLSSFRKSEKARSRYIKPWERYFNGTRDSLIEKMRHNPDLAPWVDRYICLEGDFNLIGRLFCEELADGVFFPIKKEMEEVYYNPDNWLSILTVAAILQEYDELHGATSPTVAAADKHDDTALVVKLSLCFINEEVARKFLTAVRDMDDDLTIALVQSYQNQKLCTDTTIRLWRMLKDAGLYKASFSNWNKHMNKGYHKP